MITNKASTKDYRRKQKDKIRPNEKKKERMWVFTLKIVNFRK